MKVFRHNHPGCDRDSQYRRKYGISTSDFDAMLLQQGGCCSICHSNDPGPQGRFHIDHNHTTGRVRGLLCQACNTGLGKFRDNVLLLEAAIRYLHSHNELSDDTN